MTSLDEKTVEDLYTWVDSLPLTRPKKDFRRDFSDGVLIAEVVKTFFPHYVDLHNYASAQATNKKVNNWQLLNRKVFRRFGFEVSDDIINNIVACKPSTIEQFLLLLKQRMANVKLEHHISASRQSARSDSPSAKTKIDDTSPTCEGSKGDSFTNVDDTSCAIGAIKLQMKSREKPSIVRSQSSLGNCCNKCGSTKSSSTIGSGADETEYKEHKHGTIKALEAKVKRLEHMLSVRDVRYADLQGRYSRLEKQFKSATAASSSKIA